MAGQDHFKVIRKLIGTQYFLVIEPINPNFLTMLVLHLEGATEEVNRRFGSGKVTGAEMLCYRLNQVAREERVRLDALGFGGLISPGKQT